MRVKLSSRAREDGFTPPKMAGTSSSIYEPTYPSVRVEWLDTKSSYKMAKKPSSWAALSCDSIELGLGLVLVLSRTQTPSMHIPLS